MHIHRYGYVYVSIYIIHSFIIISHLILKYLEIKINYEQNDKDYRQSSNFNSIVN